jgi:hypothetical protein
MKTLSDPVFFFAAVLEKELVSYFSSLLAYVVMSVFLVLSAFFFYTNLAFFITMGGFDLNRGLWQYQFHDMRLVLLLIAPLLTMRLFAEERRQGTLELLWTYPVGDTSIIAGKFAAALVVLGAMLVATLSYPLAIGFLYPIGAGRLPRPVPARSELPRLRDLRVLADREPAGGRHGDVRPLALFLGAHLEPGGGQRPPDRGAHPGLAL